MELELPFPPSVNHIWRRVGQRTVLSRKGREYRQKVRELLVAYKIRPLLGRLAIAVEVCPPDERRRDLDNILKALLDALQQGGAYIDDSQIDYLRISRGEVVKGGQVKVRLGLYEATKPGEPILANDQARPRSCLKCGKPFFSAGPGNRICDRCDARNARLGVREAHMRGERGVKRHNNETQTSCPDGSGFGFDDDL